MSDKTFVDRQSVSKSKNNSKWVTKAHKSRTYNGSSVEKKKGDVDDDSFVTNLRKLSPTKMTRKQSRSKMGNPIIVEDTLQKCPTLRVPGPLRHAVTARCVADPLLLLSTFDAEETKDPLRKTKKAKITVAQCIKPTTRNQSTEGEGRPTIETSLSRETDREFEESFDIRNDSPKTVAKKIIKSPVDRSEKNSTPRESKKRFGLSNETSIVPENDVSVDETYAKQSPRFYNLKNKILAIIEPYCKFCFHGKLRLRVLYGAVRIYGARLNVENTRTPVEIYSPRTCSPIAIETVDTEIHERNMDEVWKSLTDLCADRKIAKRLQTDTNSLDDGWSVVELENFDNSLTNFLVSHYPVHLFPKIDDPSNHSWIDVRRAEIVLQSNIRSVENCKQTSICSRGIDDFADGVCYDWETNSVSRTVIAGGKGVGKSTTVRYLVNKLLAKSKAVLVLDLDPGQAEFTPAGCLSLNVVEKHLLGPNFTHLENPYHQFYIGSVDVTRCIGHYVDAVKKLAERIVEDPKLGRLPVVVNTMGFCKGIGWDIINYVIRVVGPTDVVQILSKRSRNNFEDTLSRQVVDRQSVGLTSWTKDTMNGYKPARHRVHVIYSEAETVTGNAESWNLEPHQQRELVMIAYLSKIVRNDRALSALSQRTVMPSINAVTPYAVPFSAISVSLAGAFIPQVLSVMNGNIVALCGVDDVSKEPTEQSNGGENIVARYPRVLIRPPLSTCYGFGILRGVDMAKERLYVNTPLTSDRMKHVNCLVGCVNLPLSLLQLDQQTAPYTGSQHGLPTSRGSRRGYYRMRRQVDG